MGMGPGELGNECSAIFTGYFCVNTRATGMINYLCTPYAQMITGEESFEMGCPFQVSDFHSDPPKFGLEHDFMIAFAVGQMRALRIARVGSPRVST